MEDQGNVILSVGILLGAALLAGVLAERLRLPKVTAYLLVGLLLGPYTLDSLPPIVLSYLPEQLFAVTTISERDLELLDPVAKFAMALVLFNMGCSFTLREIHDHLRQILRLSAGELVLTFTLVTVGLMLVREPWTVAILFGALALATAPATTVLVLKENQSEGPLTRSANSLVALNNMASILLFEVLLVVVLAVSGGSSIPIAATVLQLVTSLCGALISGLLAGLIVATATAFLARGRWPVMLIAVTATLQGLCHQWDLPYLFTFLIMGATVANTSDRTNDIVGQLDQVTGLLCVVFFVIHGTQLDARTLLGAGVLGVAYIGLRATGKYLGVYWVARPKDGVAIKRWLGATLMSQAGAAIALSAMAAERHPVLGEHLRDIILGTVVVFEIVGPILIRQAVIRAGEVPLGTAIHHHESSFRDVLRSLLHRFRAVSGQRPQVQQLLESLTVADLMRPAKGLAASAPFAEVVESIECTHDDALPVVDRDGTLVGMISYRELRDAYFDPGLGPLVRAADLAMTSALVLRPDEPVLRAWQEFERSRVDCLPVVSRRQPRRLIGVIRRRDLLAAASRIG